jgi:hydrogenase 3 maturation protease
LFLLSGVYLQKRKRALRKTLETWLSGSGKIVIAGIGNPIRTDDFVGVKIIRDLQDKVSENVVLIECETVPESYLQDIIDLKPSHVLIIDAAILELSPGETRFINPEQVTDFPAITTHVLPLRIFCEYISTTVGSKVGLLLIQPGNVEFGEGLKPEVEAAAEKIASLLLEQLGSEKTSQTASSIEKRFRAESKGGMGDKT